jgi:hypothetical protein
MKIIDILFDKELYEDKAVRGAAEAFRTFTRISVSDEDAHYRLKLASLEDENEASIIIGEIMNFVLARTVELRAK